MADGAVNQEQVPYLQRGMSEAEFTLYLKSGLNYVRRSQGFSVEALRERIDPSCRPPRSTTARLFNQGELQESSSSFLVFLVLDVLGVSLQDVLQVGKHVAEGLRGQDGLSKTEMSRDELRLHVARWIPNEREFREGGRWVIDAERWRPLLGDWTQTLDRLGDDLTNGLLEERLRSLSDYRGIRTCTLAVALSNSIGSRRAIALCLRKTVRTFDRLDELDKVLTEVDRKMMEDGPVAALTMLTKRNGPVRGISPISGSTYLYLRSLGLGSDINRGRVLMMRPEVARIVAKFSGKSARNRQSYSEFLAGLTLLAREFNTTPASLEFGLRSLLIGLPTKSRDHQDY